MTVAPPLGIQQLYLAYTGRPADPAALTAWPASGLSLEAIVLQLVASGEYQVNTVDPNSTPAPGGGRTFNDTNLINTFYLRLFGRLATGSEVAGWSSALASGAVNYDYLGITILNAGLNLPVGTEMRQVLVAKIESSQLYSGILFNNPVDAAAYSTAAAIQDGIAYSQSITTATPATLAEAQAAVNQMVADSGAGGGQTFTLTTAIEVVPPAGAGMPANSTVNGVIANGTANGQTFQTGDTINGNATSALNVTISQAAPANVIATVNNMGAVNFRTFAADTVNNILFNGVGSVSSLNSTADLTIQNGELASVYGLFAPVTNTVDLTVDIRDSDLTGAADTLQFAVAGATAGSTLTNGDAGVENVSVATTGNNSFSVRRDAAARDGVLTITGAGINTVDIGAQLATNATFIGTGGTNTLVLNGTPAFSTNVTLRDFAGLTFAGATQSNILFAAGSTTPVVNLLEDNNTNVSVSGLGSITTINLVGNGGAGATSQFGAFAVNGGYTGTADTVAINVGNAGTSKTGAFGYTLAGDLILNGAETVNVTVSDIAATGVTALSAGAITSNALSTFTVVTPGNLTGAGGDIVAGATTLSAVNFSGVAGTADIGTQSFNMANGGVITGSVGAFTGLFDGLDTAASTYTFNGNAAIDTIRFTGSTGVVNINTLAGNDIIRASTGGGRITPGVGADDVTLTGSTGAVVLSYILGDSGLTAATADTITGFATTVDDFSFGLFAGTVTNFEDANTGAVTDFADALADANTFFAANAGVLYYFDDDGTDGFLFVNYDGNGTADLGVTLLGTTAIAAGDIIA